MEPCESFTLAVSWKILQRRNPSLQSSLNALLYFLWLLCKPFSKTGSFQHSTRILKILFSHSEVQGTEYIGDWIHRGLLFCILSKHSNPGSPLPLCGQVLHGAFLFEKFQKEVVLVSMFIYIPKLQGRHGRPFQELLIIPFFIMDLQILRASKNLGDIPLSMRDSTGISRLLLAWAGMRSNSLPFPEITMDGAQDHTRQLHSDPSSPNSLCGIRRWWDMDLWLKLLGQFCCLLESWASEQKSRMFTTERGVIFVVNFT